MLVSCCMYASAQEHRHECGCALSDVLPAETTLARRLHRLCTTTTTTTTTTAADADADAGDDNHDADGNHDADCSDPQQLTAGILSMVTHEDSLAAEVRADGDRT
jgi:hypothetical protein